MSVSKGKVYLVGAGPGDPGLITIKGARVLREAEVIFYDALVHPELLHETAQSAERIPVGKQAQPRKWDQKGIEAAMIESARKGKRVVRLRVGDPFIFGRGSEEAESLQKAGVDYEIVPGVASAVAVPTYAGIPLTHRDISSEVAFVKDDSFERVAWDALVGLGTVVFLMGRTSLRSNLSKLIAYGKPADTPAAIISQGTYPNQKTVVGTLGDLADKADKAKVVARSIVVIGRVVSLRKIINWYESKPLFNKKILLTRTQGQSSTIARLLMEEGADVMELPTIDIVPPKSFRSLDEAIENRARYSWVIFTSANGVEAFWGRLAVLGYDSRSLSGQKVGAIGPATADALARHGIRVDLLPETFKAEGILDALDRNKIRNESVLIPRAREGRELLVEGLKERGCRVDVVEAYVNKYPSFTDRDVNRVFGVGRPDWIVFASSSSAVNLKRMVGQDRFKESVRGIRVVCIGPITEKTAREAGFNVVVTPKEYTIQALVEALVNFSKTHPVSQ